MKAAIGWAWVGAALLALPPAAPAQVPAWPAYTARSVNLRAGPAREYPVVAVLPPQYPVQVLGCTPDYRWCDTLAGTLRGWLYGGNLDYVDQGMAAPILQDGAQLGIAIIGFTLGDYWGRYYHDRPFYRDRDRDRWARRPPPAWPGRNDRRHDPDDGPHAPPPGARTMPLPAPGARQAVPPPMPPAPPRVQAPRPAPHGQAGAPPPRQEPRPRDVPRAQAPRPPEAQRAPEPRPREVPRAQQREGEGREQQR
ncbi:MAG: SH3 domain-containing protein [Burkholderiales bacterium]|nr:SH3 domain-containing protein [Burkholderiales bacterium]